MIDSTEIYLLKKAAELGVKHTYPILQMRVKLPPGTSLYVRGRPSTKAPPVGHLHGGDVVQVLETSGEFTRISNGWIKSSFLENL